jgi:hypothetical protein
MHTVVSDDLHWLIHAVQLWALKESGCLRTLLSHRAGRVSSLPVLSAPPVPWKVNRPSNESGSSQEAGFIP